MFSLLYDITLQTKLFKRKLLPNNVCLFFDKKVIPVIKHRHFKHKNHCQSRETNPRHLALQSDALPLHHRVNWNCGMLLRLFNYFSAMNRTVNKQSRIAYHTFSTFLFWVILACIDNYISQFLVLTGWCFTADIWMKCTM